MNINEIVPMENIVINGLLKLIEDKGVDLNSIKLSINYSNGNQSPEIKIVDAIAYLQHQFAELSSGDWVLVPKEKIESLVNELHAAFQSNLHLTNGELLPLQQDFQLMLEKQHSENKNESN